MVNPRHIFRQNLRKCINVAEIVKGAFNREVYYNKTSQQIPIKHNSYCIQNLF